MSKKILSVKSLVSVTVLGITSKIHSWIKPDDSNPLMIWKQGRNWSFLWSCFLRSWLFLWFLRPEKYSLTSDLVWSLLAHTLSYYKDCTVFRENRSHCSSHTSIMWLAIKWSAVFLFSVKKGQFSSFFISKTTFLFDRRRVTIVWTFLGVLITTRWTVQVLLILLPWCSRLVHEANMLSHLGARSKSYLQWKKKPVCILRTSDILTYKNNHSCSHKH